MEISFGSVRLCRRAFTLIEMLVVVAIIAILAAMLMPSLQKALQRARGAACMGGPVKNIGSMISMYANDFNDNIPPTCGNAEGGDLWYMCFWNAGYLNNGLEMWCPSMAFERFINWQDFYKPISVHATAQAYGSMASAVYFGTDRLYMYPGFYRLSWLKRPSKQIFGGDAAFNLNPPIGGVGKGCFAIRPSATDMGPEYSNGGEGRVDARHANCAALVNFGGNAELFQFFDREAPWLNAPFGQPDSEEYRRRCTNKP